MMQVDGLEAMEAYMADVLEERVVAGKLERLMVERHVHDLQSGRERGLAWQPDLGQLVVDFCGLLQHSKGRWAGQPLVLEPWQTFLVMVLFGWMRADGTRRFRRAYFEVARKNGKSTLASALALYGLVADGEPGAEIYCGATKKEQAKIVFAEAQRMVRSSPALADEVEAHQNAIFIRDTASRFVPLSADDKRASGHNTHFAIMDELHEHRTDELFQIMWTSMGAREQPLMLSTTTAGDDEASPCGQERAYAVKVLEGTVEADEFFAAIYAIDEEAEWTDATAWRKANPNLGVTVTVEEMRDLVKEARDKPSALSALLRYRLNVWLSTATRWLPQEAWRACGELDVDEAELEGRTCYGGLDLASVEDLAAWALVFPPEEPEGVYQVLCRCFAPQEAIVRRSREVGVPYDAWTRAGWLTATPGEVIDYAFIFAQIDSDAQRFDIVDVAFDRWGAARVYTELESQGLTMLQMGQGFASMSGPSKEFERLVRIRRLAYGHNPILRWAGANVVVDEDPRRNIAPTKKRSKDKIDPVVALIMALDRSMRHGGPKRSVYEDRGLAGVI